MAVAAPGPVKREEPLLVAAEQIQKDGTVSSSLERTGASGLPSEAEPLGKSQSPMLDLSWSSLDGSEAFSPMAGRRHWDHCEERASRPGNSRIPGRDHRRYYHNHWRLEYLMDFDARGHSMICMVCGSSLATLKLSTIKRHIHQKHPYSVNWSAKEKEAIITSWDAHLCLEATSPGADGKGMPDCLPRSPEDPLIPDRKRRRRLPPVAKRACQSPGRVRKASLDTGDLEQYLNESLQNWFRMEFMMDYNSQKNKLFCMMCGSMLASLNLQDIKQHILEAHPKSLDFSEEEKSIILGAWDTKSLLERLKKKEEEEDSVEEEEEEQPDDDEVQEILSTASTYQVEKKSPTLMPVPAPAPISIPAPIPLPSLAPVVVSAPFAILCPVRIPSSSQTRVTYLSLPSRTVPASIIVNTSAPASVQPSAHVDLTQDESEEESLADPPSRNGQESSVCSTPSQQPSPDEVTWVDDPEPNVSDLTPSKGRGRDHRRYYQERWRMEYLMDYNCLTHGLVCMVCGSSLTTMKLSTIKRHIHQKHEDTIFLSNAEKLVICEEWERKVTRLEGSGTSLLDPSENQNFVIAGNGTHVEKQKPVPPDFVAQGNKDTPAKRLSPAASACSTPTSPTRANSTDSRSSEDCAKASSWDFCFSKTRGRGQDHRSHYQDRWRLEYMMDYNRAKNGLLCMVCGCAMPTLKLSTIKMHIQQKHPDSAYLSDQEKAVIMEEWTQKRAEKELSSAENPDTPSGTDRENCVDIPDDRVNQSPAHEPVTKKKKKKNTKKAPIAPSPPPVVEPPEAAACSSNPFKNQRRNYQVRWRTEYMMDYDCRRHGLICMVCGGTLATLKVSTIKRHVLQVHPYSVDFSPPERRRIQEAYSQMAQHYIHSEACFKQSQPGLPHHSRPACGSIAGTKPHFPAASDDVIVI